MLEEMNRILDGFYHAFLICAAVAFCWAVIEIRREKRNRRDR